MRVSRHIELSPFQAALPCAAMLLFFTRLGLAQEPQPSSLSISPGAIHLGECFTLTVGNGAEMNVDFQYTLNNGPVQTTTLKLDANGQYTICTTSDTPVGTYNFVGIKNAANSTWVPVSATITISGPPDFSPSVSPSSGTVDQGQSTSYTVSVSAINGFNSSVSLSASGLPPGASAAFSPNPVSYGGVSTLTVITSTTASTGPFAFTVTGTGGGQTHSASPTILIKARQPTSLSISPSQGYAGVDCYTMTVGNGSGMTVVLQYTLKGVSQPDWSVGLDPSGRWGICLPHDTATGLYAYTAIRNQDRSDWVTLNRPATCEVFPPQPTWLSITPASVTAGQGSYRMTAGNGARIALDLQYTLNGVPADPITGWPSLEEVAQGSPDGKADIGVRVCTPPGITGLRQRRTPATRRGCPFRLPSLSIRPPRPR